VQRALFFSLGCLFTAVFEPAGLWPLAPALLLPFLYVSLKLPARTAAIYAFCFGLGMFLCGTYWIYLSVTGPGNAAWWIGVFLVIVLTLIMAGYLALTAWLINRLANGNAWYLLAVAPTCWVFIEWLRGWLFSGFPWMSLGYSQIDTALAGWAPLLGVYGVSLLLVVSVASLLIAILERGRRRLLAIAVVLLPWIVGAGLSTLQWTQADGEVINTTLIQAGVPQERKWLAEEREPTKDFYRERTQGAADSKLVIWPEVAIPSVSDREETYIRSLQQISQRNAQTIVFGILEREYVSANESRIYNSVIAINGQQREVYRKRHLVPFGEYFPVPSFVRNWMRMMSLPFSDLTPGADEQALLSTAGGTRLTVAICYEDSYGAEMLYAMPEAGLIVNVSNDAWFGDSIAPHQHLQIARMRSLEVGRESVRATNTGISAFIDARGRVRATGAQFEAVEMSMDVQPRSGMTPYARFGNWPVISLCLLVIGGFWLRSRSS
jgi:apolipoprotein N-acyltransferase